MYTDTKLEGYRKESPKNRAEKRNLLRKQGWYYEIGFVISMIHGRSWTCYKVYKNNNKVLFDQEFNTEN